MKTILAKISSEHANISISLKSNTLSINSETPRLVIRSYENKDFKHCLSLYSDESITKYFDHGRPRSTEEINEYIQSRGRKYFDRGEPFGLFSIFLKNNLDFVGQVDLVPTEIPGVVEIGWILHKKYHGQGYCSEAVLDFLIILIEDLISKEFKSNGIIIQKVIATAHPENIGSRRIIEKIGMSFDKFQERYGGNPRFWYSYTPSIHDCPKRTI